MTVKFDSRIEVSKKASIHKFTEICGWVERENQSNINIEEKDLEWAKEFQSWLTS